MTKTQARAWARRMFGKDGDAVRAPEQSTMKNRQTGEVFVTRDVCLVGQYRDQLGFAGFEYYGHGPTWEAAVKDAEQRTGKFPRGFSNQFKCPRVK